MDVSARHGVLSNSVRAEHLRFSEIIVCSVYTKWECKCCQIGWNSSAYWKRTTILPHLLDHLHNTVSYAIPTVVFEVLHRDTVSRYDLHVSGLVVSIAAFQTVVPGPNHLTWMYNDKNAIRERQWNNRTGNNHLPANDLLENAFNRAWRRLLTLMSNAYFPQTARVVANVLHY